MECMGSLPLCLFEAARGAAVGGATRQTVGAALAAVMRNYADIAKQAAATPNVPDQVPLVAGQRIVDFAKTVGCQHIGELRRRLRCHGACSLASRLGKLSKQRNAAAHPQDVDKLLCDVAAALAAPLQPEVHEGGSPIDEYSKQAKQLDEVRAKLKDHDETKAQLVHARTVLASTEEVNKSLEMQLDKAKEANTVLHEAAASNARQPMDMNPAVAISSAPTEPCLADIAALIQCIATQQAEGLAEGFVGTRASMLQMEANFAKLEKSVDQQAAGLGVACNRIGKLEANVATLETRIVEVEGSHRVLSCRLEEHLQVTDTSMDEPCDRLAGAGGIPTLSLAPGDLVELHGLRSAELNGQHGEVVKFLGGDECRFAVRLATSSEPKAIRPINLRKLCS